MWVKDVRKIRRRQSDTRDEKWRNPTVRRSGERCNVFGQQNSNFQIVIKSGGKKWEISPREKRCDNCNHSEATLKTKITLLPPILIIYLKRYKYGPLTNGKVKKS